MKAIMRVGIIACCVALLCSDSFAMSVPLPPAMTDAEMVVLLTQQNKHLQAQLNRLSEDCQERWEDGLDDVEDAIKRANKLQVELHAAQRQIQDLKGQRSFLATLHSEDQTKIRNLTQQLQSVKNEVGMLEQDKFGLEAELERCDELLQTNSTAEVQLLLQEWAARDQTTMNQLRQQVLDVQAENRMLTTSLEYLDTQWQRSFKTIEGLREKVRELYDDLNEEELDALEEECDAEFLEKQLEHQEKMLELCEKEVKRLTPPIQL